MAKILLKMNFLGKKRLCHLIFQLSTIAQKNRKKLINHSWGERRTDSLTEVWQFKQSELSLNCWDEIDSRITFNLFLFFILFLFVKIYREDVETRADLNLLFFLNLTKNLLQEFGIVKLVTFRMHAMRVISIFNFWY